MAAEYDKTFKENTKVLSYYPPFLLKERGKETLSNQTPDLTHGAGAAPAAQPAVIAQPIAQKPSLR